MKLEHHLLRLGRAIHRRSPHYSDKLFSGEVCPACGKAADIIMRGVLWPELILQWELSPAWANWIDQREGLRCACCHANLRSRQLAQSIVIAMNSCLGTNSKTLAELVSNTKFQKLNVAEINAAGDLHPILKPLPLLHYSEFESTNPDIPSENLHNLSYPDESFDLAITSDVLEHVPDVERALSEIKRILKPNGLHIFTVPVVWNKACSRRRAEVINGSLTHLLPASHHGAVGQGKDDFLVFNEFGRDFIQLCEKIGFSISLNKDKRNPSLICFTSQRKN